MKKRIHKYDYQNGIITVIHENKYLNLYLTNSNKRRFKDLFEVGCFIEIRVNFTRKKIINRLKCFQVVCVIKIEKPTHRTTRTVFSIDNLRKKLIKDITKDKHYLFLDLEMTMPPYYPVKDFQAEIIQVGYYLTDNKCNVIKYSSYYVKPTKFKTVSKRTLKFLNLEREAIKDSEEYSYFYNDLKELVNTYNPKIVVWGKNDYLAMKASFSLNKEKPIIARNRVINLLTEVKNYYNLFNDVGLFSAYEVYYNDMPTQRHDALSDAYILYRIYEAFIKKEERDRAFIER
jgi:sporulation inhibitor KapD